MWSPHDAFRRHTNLESKNEKNTFNRILLINVFECLNNIQNTQLDINH